MSTFRDLSNNFTLCTARADIAKIFATLPRGPSTMVLTCADHALEHAASDKAYACNFLYHSETFGF